MSGIYFQYEISKYKNKFGTKFNKFLVPPNKRNNLFYFVWFWAPPCSTKTSLFLETIQFLNLPECIVDRIINHIGKSQSLKIPIISFQIFMEDNESGRMGRTLSDAENDLCYCGSNIPKFSRREKIIHTYVRIWIVEK